MRTHLLAPGALSLILFLLAPACGRTSAATASASSPRPAATQGRFAGRESGIQAIAREALERGQSWEMLEDLTTVAPKRLAGSEGAAKAIEWGVAAMQAAGFDEVRREACRVPHWVRGEVAELVATAPDELKGESFSILALGGSVRTPEDGHEGGLVVVNTFDELQELGEAALGKFVLFDRPMDDAMLQPFAAYGGTVVQRSRGAIEAARVKAIGAIVRSMTMARDDVPHTGALQYETDLMRVPAVAVSTLGADRLAQLAAEEPDLRLRMTLDCHQLEDADSFNVVGEVRGTELPDEIVLLGAHLDAWDVGSGAHDDGAGCVQVIEAVRLLLALDLRPRRTLRVVLFMNEENGLRGARTYAADHESELERHVLALESDRGGFTPRGFTTTAKGEDFAMLSEAAALLAPLGAGEMRPGGGGADIGVLAPAGVPLVGYLPDAQRYFDFHHSENDVLEAVHPRELALGAAAIAGLVWMVADLE